MLGLDRKDQWPVKCLKMQLHEKLLASARAGEMINSSKFAGQIDILHTILELPEKELNKAMGTTEPVILN